MSPSLKKNSNRFSKYFLSSILGRQNHHQSLLDFQGEKVVKKKFVLCPCDFFSCESWTDYYLLFWTVCLFSHFLYALDQRERIKGTSTFNSLLLVDNYYQGDYKGTSTSSSPTKRKTLKVTKGKDNKQYLCLKRERTSRLDILYRNYRLDIPCLQVSLFVPYIFLYSTNFDNCTIIKKIYIHTFSRTISCRILVRFLLSQRSQRRLKVQCFCT